MSADQAATAQPGQPREQPVDEKRGGARMLRLAIAVAGALLVLASRLPWFSVDVEALQIDDVSLMGNELFRGMVGYRVASDRFVLAMLGVLITVTAGMWAFRVGMLLARPLLLVFSGLVVAWSTLAVTDLGTVRSESDATEGMAVSAGPLACLVLGVTIFVATAIARLSATDLPEAVATIDRLMTHGRAPAAAVLSRRLLEAVERSRGPEHPETIRAALTHVACLLFAGFPELADLVLKRVETRPEIEQDPEAADATRRMRGEVAQRLGPASQS